jgi:hypothetical protein
MIALGENIVEITLLVEGMAALQGIPLHELPPNRAAARIAIGNAINRTMMTFVMTAVSLSRTLNRLPFLGPVFAAGWPLDNPGGPWNQLKKSPKAG